MDKKIRLEIEAKPVGRGFTAIVGGETKVIQARPFVYLVLLAWHRKHEFPGFVDFIASHIAASVSNATDMIYLLRKQSGLDRHTIITDHARRYCLSLSPEDIQFNYDYLTLYPDSRVAALFAQIE